MSFIRTYTGLHFDPVEPDAEKIRIGDIAHALSLLCRANGHVTHFYSVAQHSIVCAKEAEARNLSRKIRLACLLHDASEAYLSDVTRPVKPQLPFYLEVETRLQDLIWRRFLGEDLTEAERKEVFAIDDAVLALEFRDLMYEEIGDQYRDLKGSYALSPAKDPGETEREFLEMAEMLSAADVAHAEPLSSCGGTHAGPLSACEKTDAALSAGGEIFVRPYRPEDLPAMIRIWNEVVEEGIAFPQEDLLDAESGTAFFASQTHAAVAVRGGSSGGADPAASGTVCGLYILHPNNVGRCGHICNASYAVASAVRGRHIGELLVKDCLAEAGRHGFSVLQFNAVVESNVHARHLYERLGFTPLGVIPKGFRMKDGHYENICPYYHLL